MKLSIVNLLALLVSTLVLISCSSSREIVKSKVKARGEVIKEYDLGDSNYLLIKEGEKIVKYRVYDWPAGMGMKGSTAKGEYTLNLLTKNCFEGNEKVDCQTLIGDADLKPYIQKMLRK